MSRWSIRQPNPYLAPQLLYNAVILRRVYRACEAQRSDAS